MSDIKVKELKESERPREKALKYGMDTLSNKELLAIILRCGYKDVSVLELADKLLNVSDGLVPLFSMSFDELVRIKGISVIKALELMSVFELSKRSIYAKLKNAPVLNDPQMVYNYLNKKIGLKKQEHFYVLYLNVKNQIIHENTVFVGTLNVSVVHPREVFKEAIQKHAAAIIVAHNHPSGSAEPSKQDLQLTNKLIESGKIIGIPIIDHIIVAQNNHFSFVENGLIHHEK
ncbi:MULTISPECIES: DNA repair protein RadC [unclassified Breznakia]|uniref:RadC family protein n=1 Tax=unclassified Breznakia TaxID=2623764 RepID=UPI0024772276|nr:MULTISPECIES: DNA repair protein RadC [unclassified Breznakia]MDH6367757.1 DNA repair protein RadC [Breznakia sp. PH1-1]MDH6404845.1 DNA repair protein RadC [Breznakia sp. PF1-11]MDH6412529.1 DNA repair protein RadC [Breznakia sp. PFB1-11]MDH6414920.1 DNA repair protein RadC [Breznakia sp. PFB1-14]MDH6417200.1 DNA repair protein RadC [Breznakia sp. PFB1-4]